MFDQEFDFELDQIEVSINNDELSVEQIQYPHLYLSNLVLSDQIRGLVENPDPSLLVVDAYGEKGGAPKYIGKVELTATNVMMMKYLGVGVKLIKNASGDSNDFSTPESLVSIIKTLNRGDTVAIVDSDIPVHAG
jgi:hypothetical protein